ncbi:MAG: prenyltransferase/squalene oxidase repeat-containing protein [Solirubrobacterales bacterium]
MSMRRRVTAMAAVVALAALPAGAQAATPATISESVALGAGWLRAQQDPATGLVSGFGGDWSLSAMAAAGVNAADWRAPEPGAPSAQDAYLAEWTSSAWLAPVDPDNSWLSPDFRSASDFARATLLAHAAGLQPSRLSADQNLVAQLAAAWRGDGQYGSAGLNGAMFAMMALAQEHVPQAVLDKTVALIRANRHDDGGWSYGLVTSPEAAASASDVDMTGAGVAALCAAGVPATDPDVQSALAFLRGQLEDSGGFTTPWSGTNADSNAWVVAGLNACGIDPQSPAWTTGSASTPLDFLVSLQRTSGANAGSSAGSRPRARRRRTCTPRRTRCARSPAACSRRRRHRARIRRCPPWRQRRRWTTGRRAVRPGHRRGRRGRPLLPRGRRHRQHDRRGARGGPAHRPAGRLRRGPGDRRRRGHRARWRDPGHGRALDRHPGRRPAGPGRAPARVLRRRDRAVGRGRSGSRGRRALHARACCAADAGADPGPATTAASTSTAPSATAEPEPESGGGPREPAAQATSAERTPRLSGSRRLRLDRTGHIRVRIACPPAATAGCRGTVLARVWVRQRRGGTWRTVGRVRYRGDAAATTAARIRLARRPGRRRRPGPPRAAPRGASAGPVRAPVGAPRGGAPAR